MLISLLRADAARWRRPESRDMSPERTNPGERLPLTVAQRIDDVCAQFEAGWQQGRLPRLEDFLDGAAGAELAELLRQLLRVELEYRRRCGEIPALDDYLPRFPGQEAVVREEVA